MVVVGSLGVALLVRKNHTPPEAVTPVTQVVVTPLPKTVRWLLKTTPDGAAVIDESGQTIGQTPWSHEASASTGELLLTVRKTGFGDLRVSFAKDRDVERSEVLSPVTPPTTTPPPRITEPRPPKRTVPSKGRKNDSLILDFKTHKKLN